MKFVAENLAIGDKMQKPSVGRIVHYQSYGTPNGEYKPEARAAIITEVVYDDRLVKLCIFNPGGLFFCEANYSEEPKGGCWSWPPKV